MMLTCPICKRFYVPTTCIDSIFPIENREHICPICNAKFIVVKKDDNDFIVELVK